MLSYIFSKYDNGLVINPSLFPVSIIILWKSFKSSLVPSFTVTPFLPAKRILYLHFWWNPAITSSSVLSFMSSLNTNLGCISSLKSFASSFILYPKFVTISLNAWSSFSISGSILSPIALYFFANSFAPSVSCFITDMSCMSHTGPLDAYIILPNIGIFLIHTHSDPIMFLSSSSASITSGFQFGFFTSAHSSDC